MHSKQLHRFAVMKIMYEQDIMFTFVRSYLEDLLQLHAFVAFCRRRTQQNRRTQTLDFSDKRTFIN